MLKLFPLPLHKKVPVTLYICATCDRNPAVMETPAAEGASFLHTVREHFRQHPQPHAKLSIRPVKCLGGCEAFSSPSNPNGCCSAALTSPGRFNYVFNRLNPHTDIWKLAELLTLYLSRPNGLIQSKASPHRPALKPHIATRVPPAK